MQKQSEISKNRSLSLSRGTPDINKRYPGKDGSITAGIHEHAVSRIGLHVLERELRSIPFFEVAYNTGQKPGKTWADVYPLIDTHAKQLQAIEDLYFIIKSQDRYKALKEPEWTEDTTNLQVLIWLLRKLGPLAEGREWTVDSYKEAGRIRYKFIVYKRFSSQMVRYQEEYLPLDFLPYLIKRDKPLHDLIVDTVALVSRENKIPLWGDDEGDFSHPLADLLSASKPPDFQQCSTMEKQILNYQSGPASTYLKLLRQRKKIVSPSKLLQDIKSYKENSQRKRSICYWIRSMCAMAREGDSIERYTLTPSQHQKAISPSRLYKFIWSAHGGDYIYHKAIKSLNKSDGYGGINLPVLYTEAKPGEQLKPLPLSEFPVELCDNLRTGNSLFRSRYEDYFYKKMLFEKETPAETLLEKIISAEIQTGRYDINTPTLLKM